MCGLSNGEYWPWCVEEGETESVPASHIGKEKCRIVDAALKDLGLKAGEEVALVFQW